MLSLVRFRSFLVTVVCFGALGFAPQAPDAKNRIVKPVDKQQLVTLTGNVHPLARSEFDLGAVPDRTRLVRLVLELVNQTGGNITGLALYETPLGGKWLELLSEIAPGLKRAAIMFNPDTVSSGHMPSLETAARSLKVTPIIAPIRSDVEIETAITTLGNKPEGGLVVVPDTFTIVHRVPILSAAARNNVPAIYWRSDYARDGGLLSCGVDQVDTFRRAATYVDRVLRSAKPSELPVQFSTKFELVVNMKTAKALGLTIPPNLLAVADEVIE
jgi:putative tryptophan/tyrosine transport system substrate-binding protein